MFIDEITITTRKDLFVPKPAVREDENCFSKRTGKLTYNSSLTFIKYKRAGYFYHVIEDRHRMLQQYLLNLYP